MTQRPEPGLWQGYDIVRPGPSLGSLKSCFDHRVVVLTFTRPRRALQATLQLTEALRGAILAHCPDPIPEWVSGHTPEGFPSRLPHLAFFPLPFVGREHAHGNILGMGLALPRQVSGAEANRCLSWLRDESGVPVRIHLFSEQWLTLQAELETRDEPPVSLRPEVWTGPATNWSTVTPIVFDRHVDGEDRWHQAAEMVKFACEHVGLPRPMEVLLHPTSLFEGVPVSREFPRLYRKRDGSPMRHSHAVIMFGTAIEGPVLLGAGRYRGYGLCRPVGRGE